MRNWADLPPDLLDRILSKVFAKDRFSLVCRSWNAVAVNLPYRYSAPCMMYYNRRTHLWGFHLHNTSFFTSFPQLYDSEIHCSKYGWLLMARNDNTLFFFDPSNNRTLDLPCAIDFDYDKIFFFHPPTSPDCIVDGINIASYKEIEIKMLKHGECEWECFEYSTKRKFQLSNAPPVLHRGQVYFLDMKGDVARFDIVNWRFVISDKCLRKQIRNYDSSVKEHYLFKLKGEETVMQSAQDTNKYSYKQ
ncbi:hypothetical protein CASFOL_015814 [Castilleja foliolosa]|uniref:F-box domain-containing protein n=1 Tax=Castilleja foliolosa TaxID=1961234 RepID=A0ABD3DGW9_9LAMI